MLLFYKQAALTHFAFIYYSQVSPHNTIIPPRSQATGNWIPQLPPSTVRHSSNTPFCVGTPVRPILISTSYFPPWRFPTRQVGIEYSILHLVYCLFFINSNTNTSEGSPTTQSINLWAAHNHQGRLSIFHLWNLLFQIVQYKIPQTILSINRNNTILNTGLIEIIRSISAVWPTDVWVSY